VAHSYRKENTVRRSYRKEIQETVYRMRQLGMDVSLRNGYGLWGLSDGDGSRDISVLYTAKDSPYSCAGTNRGDGT